MERVLRVLHARVQHDEQHQAAQTAACRLIGSRRLLLDQSHIWHIWLGASEVWHGVSRGSLKDPETKKSKLEELELTLQEEIVETSTSPDAQLPPVDPQCARQLLVPFLCSNHGVFYNAVLNRTCLKKNQNKFYKMQLVVDLCNNHHYVLFRWGRVGEKGSIKLIPCEEDILKAQLVFEERFYSKTGNRWEVWAKDSKFEKRKGKYVILKVDYSGPKTQEECIQQLPEEIANNVASSRLKPNLLKLVSLIFDLKAMKETVVRMKFDVTKFPLGMLTKEQILAGYEALDKIEDCIKRKSNKSELVEACSDFYTCVPHSFSRRKRPTLIRTELHVQEKMQQLEVLQAVQTILDLFRKEAGIKNPHPLDSLYETLECELTELDRTNDDYKIIQASLEKTHGSTHNKYHLELQNVFRIEKMAYNESFVSVGNHRMLWHGSRNNNFAGILSSGLCITPQAASPNGCMFGKGVYFADCVSKSANYCFREPQEEGLMLLCEVSLGNIKEEANAKSYDTLPRGINSIMGVGQFTPDRVGDLAMSNGVMIACGKLVNRDRPHLSLLYNEYIVYNINQVKLVYLVKVKFVENDARE
ncbi:poly [ADP-ribose] polymerase 2 isoform X2 [Rhipicephalus microplus]|uniref:poly [ADP-ribose] polymerase 2 isoform X2 n=1 Tax=Rhipicephalus microplus TaxID=6941 RepID=UPI003F6AF236